MLSIISNFGRGMKRTLFVKIFIALMLLCSMGWGYTVTMTVSSNNGGTASATSTTVSAGNTTTIKATPKTSYRFVSWYVESGSCTISSKTSATTTVEVNGNCTIRANFNLTRQLKVQVTGGTTDITSKTLDNNGSWTVTATPNPGYWFRQWDVVEGDEKLCTFDNRYSETVKVKVNTDCTIKAFYTNQAFVVASVDVGGGVYNPDHDLYAACYFYYDKGETGTLEGKAIGGYRFDHWEVKHTKAFDDYTVNGNRAVHKDENCVIKDTKAISTKITAYGDCGVDGIFIKTYYLDLSATTGGSTNFTGTKTVDNDSKNTITATPKSGYRFDKWTFNSTTACKGGSTTSATTTVTVNGDCYAKASFVKLYTLTTDAAEGGSVSPSGSTSHDEGAVVPISATPIYGYRFDKWVVSGTSCKVAEESSSLTTITMNGDCTVKALFVKRNTFDIHGSTGGVTNPQAYVTVDHGATYAIGALPDVGYRFDKWVSSSEYCAIEDESAIATLVQISADCSIIAMFVKTYDAYFSAGSGGTISPSGMNTYDSGTEVSVTATPREGYQFKDWTFSHCHIVTPTSPSVSITVDGPCVITANFVKTYTLTVNHENNGSVVTDSKSVVAGTTTNVRGTATMGFRLVSWEVDPNKNGCEIENVKALNTNVKVTGDCAMTATYRRLPYVVITSGQTISSTYGGHFDDIDIVIAYERLPWGGTFINYRNEVTAYSMSLEAGSSETLNAYPFSGFRFDHWEFIDETSYTERNRSHGIEINYDPSHCVLADPKSPSTTLTVNGDCAYLAVFLRQYDFSVKSSDGGSASASKSGIVDEKTVIKIEATPEEGYHFSKWKSNNASSCLVADEKSPSTTVTIDGNCTLTALFVKNFVVKVTATVAGFVEKDLIAVNSNAPIIIPLKEDPAYHFAYWKVVDKQGECSFVDLENQSSVLSADAVCEVKAVVVPEPGFRFTDTVTSYKADECTYKYDSYSCRFYIEESTYDWFQIELGKESASVKLFDHANDSLFGESLAYVWLSAGAKLFTKIDQSDRYVSISPMFDSFEISGKPVPTCFMNLVSTRGGDIVRWPELPIYGPSAPEGAPLFWYPYSYNGYYAEMPLIETGNCHFDSSFQNPLPVLIAGTKECTIRAVYEPDTTITTKLVIDSLVETSLPTLCADVSVGAEEFDGTIWDILNSEFVVTVNGDTVKTTLDTLWRDYQERYHLCLHGPDNIMNGEEKHIVIATIFAGKYAADSVVWMEPAWHEKDAPDTVIISEVDRASTKINVSVKTQNFSDDEMEAFETVSVKVSCGFSGDEENVELPHVKDGLYRSADLAKKEGKVSKNDGVLTCAVYDRIVAEFVDPVYKTVTRDTVAFGDVVPVDYQFLNEDLYRDIDSVEATEANFAFRLNMISPTVDKADTVMVVLFTDAGDSVWVNAVETDVYSSEFEGFGSFRFVTRKSDVRDDQLEAVMDLESDLNRVVIRMQIGADGSALNTRDSLVVFYQFIPADSAEIHDKDHDGRADFIRVHFAKSISKESLKIDSLFWGSANASGKNANASGRSVDAQSLVVSADGKWIEADLEEPFEYGVTSAAGSAANSAAGQGYLRISRKTSSVSQKVMLTDKVGAVPVSAVKRPGRLSDLDLLSGKTEMPFDTLVVTMSEPLDTMARLQCRSLRKAESGDSKDLCTAQEMFTFAGEGRVRTVYKESYSRDKSGRVWTFVLPRNVNIRVGDVVRSNWRAFVEDAAGNAMGDGGVVVTGEDSDLYIYSIKAFPEVVGSGKAPRWFNPEKGESERMEGASIRVETRMAYDATVSVFDNMGHVVSQFKHSFGKHGEKEDDAYVSDENATFVSFIRWDTKTLEKRLAGSGVYIWKIKFRFEDGHVEWRTIRSGIRR